MNNWVVYSQVYLSGQKTEQLDWVQPWFPVHRGLFSGQKPGRDVLWTIGWGTALMQVYFSGQRLGRGVLWAVGLGTALVSRAQRFIFWSKTWYNTCITAIELFLQNREQAEQSCLKKQGQIVPKKAHIEACFHNMTGKTWAVLLKKNMGRSQNHSLRVHIVFVVFGWCLCCLNFERDIVDTLCHASRKSATTRPNKSDFLLQEGKTQRPGILGLQFKLLWLSRASKLLFGSTSEQAWTGKSLVQHQVQKTLKPGSSMIVRLD